MRAVDLLKIRKREIEALHRLNKVFGVEKPLFVYIYTALNTLREYMLYEDVALWLKENNYLKLVYVSADDVSDLKSPEIKLGQGIIGKIAQLGYPEIINNLAEIKQFKNLLKRKSLENLTFFVLPILDEKKESIGVLAASRKTGDDIPVGWHIEFLEIAASVLGHHIELYKVVQKEKERLQMTIKNMEDIIYSTPTSFTERLFPKLEKIANTNINILLTGESGTGKSSLARHIHEISYRKDKPFVIINCAAIPKELLEAELFGYEKGAFTGATTTKKGKLELAHGGTAFLDEIGDLPLELQPKLLHAIQEKTIERIGGTKPVSIDVRFISATNRDLKFMVKERRFREDLFYRISGVEIRLPPLRERPDEFEGIFKNVLAKLKERYQRPINISQKAYGLLKDYDWPGNIRELENVLELAIALDDDNVIDIDDLPLKLIKHDRALRSRMDNYIKRYIKELNDLFKENKTISSEYLNYIKHLDSLQNFEDLKLLLKKSYTLDKDGVLDLDDLDIHPSLLLSKEDHSEKTTSKKKLLNQIEEIEKEEIIKALKKHRWILTKAARELGLTRRQLEYRIKKYNITP